MRRVNWEESLERGGATKNTSFSPDAGATFGSVNTMDLVLSLRIPMVWWRTDASFDRLTDFLQAHHSAMDELSLFDDDFVKHAYLSIEEVKRRAALLGERIEQLHQVGFSSVGINVIHTLGHHDLQHGEEELLPFRRMVGHDGRASNSCFCPNGADFRDYLQKKYELMARAKPDFIWVDDDLRMCDHGVTYPCFCEACIQKFQSKTELQFDRTSLVERLNSPAEGALRRQWTEFCVESLTELCTGVGSVITRTSAETAVGLMTIGQSHSTYGNQPWARWMEALGAVRGRPGHGYYKDSAPRLLLGKLMDVARQIREYPAGHRMIAYEMESFPYVPLDKSVQTVLNESALSLMVGSTGVAYNILRLDSGVLSDYEPLMKVIASERPMWEELATCARKLPLVGVWPADHPELMANREVDAGGWFQEESAYDIQKCNQLMEIGIPFTPYSEHASVTLLAGRIAEAFSVAELRQMLRGGVLMDTAALEVLWKRSLGELAGVTAREVKALIVGERFTDHPLNGAYAADGRRAQETSTDGVSALEATDPGIGELAYLVDLDGHNHGTCLSTYTNQLGGRVAVCGYYPWDQLGSAAKKHQLVALVDWLSGERLPFFIEGTVRVVPFVRRSGDGGEVLVTLLNSSLDPTGPLPLRLRGEFPQANLLTSEGNTVLSTTAANGETVVRLPPIPAWKTCMVHGKR